MENYIFSMEKVLDYREDIEIKKAEEFAKIKFEISKIEEEINKLTMELSHLKEKIGSINKVSELMQTQLYIQLLEENIDMKKLLLLEKNRSLEEKRIELTKAQTDRKVMEKLKEKDYREFKYKKNMKEQKELDDISIMKFKRAKN
ncbi:MAG: flagellar export protein FliJ [Tissierellales bacterium]|nr:flagellar export protein FliJ [Tissierellales bacterium]